MHVDYPCALLPIEQRRLAAVLELELLDTSPEADFDRLARLTARLLNVPIALVSLIERDRQFFKAKVGVALCETDRATSFCTHTIMQDGVMVVPDASADARFDDNPLVRGEHGIRFYAGISLVVMGERVGTLCVMDDKPNSGFSSADQALLKDCAALVVTRMEMRRFDEALRISQQRLRSIASTSPDGIVCSDVEGNITFWNEAAQQLFGYTSEEAVGKPVDIIVPSWMQGRHTSGMARVAGGRETHLVGKTVDLTARHRDGDEFPIELSLSMWTEGDKLSFGAIIRDITMRRRNEERLFQLARVDPLTDLPNRAAIMDHLDEIIANGARTTVLVLDLDGFKEVNDTIGHPAGDRVLEVVGARTRAIVPQEHVVGRLSGDEFVVLLSTLGEDACVELGRRIIAEINKPIEMERETVHVGVCIGAAQVPHHADTAAELLSNADLALYAAKREGPNLLRLFKPALRQQALLRRRMVEELRTALDDRQFVMFYQPQVRLSDGLIVGAEALIRWNHPTSGLLMPAAFLPALDATPFAAEVGAWTIEAACAQAERWRQKHPNFRVAINLFGAQFAEGAALVETVGKALAATGLPAQCLELEITENIILRQDQALLEPLRRLREMGVGLAFDDYGTGYASLSLLKRYPITRLKIDRTFVQGVCNDDRDAAIVKAVISLASTFGFHVTAEGVETEQESSFLRRQGCGEGQGYLYGRPQPANEFGALLQRWHPDRVA